MKCVYHYLATGYLLSSFTVKRDGIYVTSTKIRCEDDYIKMKKHIEEVHGLTIVIIENLTLIDEDNQYDRYDGHSK